jgi:CRP-like cAMP-binding protein
MPQVELFDGCSARELCAISRLCTPVSVRAGRVLCRQGELAEECFIVVDGRADVFIDDSLVASVGVGHILGELALLARSAVRTATVLAATDMQLLAFSRREFSSLAGNAPGVHQRVLREASRRVVENAERR